MRRAALEAAAEDIPSLTTIAYEISKRRDLEQMVPHSVDSFRISPGASIYQFAAALYVLHRELADVHVRGILAAYRAIPTGAFVLALGLTALSYIVLSGYI